MFNQSNFVYTLEVDYSKFISQYGFYKGKIGYSVRKKACKKTNKILKQSWSLKFCTCMKVVCMVFPKVC